MSNSSDPFKILGVNESATNNEIKAAYLKLAKSYHPDINNTDTNAKLKFQEISASYELIKTEITRAQYFSNSRRNNSFNEVKYDTNATYDSYIKDKQKSSFEKFLQRIYKNSSYSKFTIIFPVFIVLSITFSFMKNNKVNNVATNSDVHINKENVVMAWLNPTTKRWETPAPWDPIYRKSIETKPLQLVRKELVHDNIISRGK